MIRNPHQVRSAVAPVLAALALAGCQYEAIENPLIGDPPSVVTGSLVVTGVDSPHNGIVLAFDAANPGPPEGTGLPFTFATVTSTDFTQVENGVESAPFTMTALGPTAGETSRTVNLAGLVDQDDNFNPVNTALAGATCGDFGGFYLENLLGTTPAALEVTPGDLVENVSVVVGQEFTTERPAFFADGKFEASIETGSKSANADGQPVISFIQQYRLTATGIHTDYGAAVQSRDPDAEPTFPLDLDDACTPLDPTACDSNVLDCHCDAATTGCSTAFWITLVDADNDGALDPYPDELQAAAGLYDVWPRIFLVYAGDALKDGNNVVGYSELDLDPRNNVLAPATADYPYVERWVAENYPYAFELNLLPSTELGELNTPFPMHDMSVLWSPVFRHYYQGGRDGHDANGDYDLVDVRCTDVGVPNMPTCVRKADISSVPTGDWSVTLVEKSGQTWQLPNEIEWYGLKSTGGDFDPKKQGAVFQVKP